MKKFALLTLAVLMCLSLCSCETLLRKARAYVTGDEAEEAPKDLLESRKNEEYQYDVYKDHILLRGYLGGETDVLELPAELDGRPVTAIGSLFLFEKSPVKSVVIPESVNEICESAFYYSDALESVTIPNSVTVIGQRAFGWCNALVSVTLGRRVKEIPDYCFNHCDSLKTVVIPENVTSVGVRAFSYCGSLTDVDLPSSIASVGDLAFADCQALQYVGFTLSGTSLGRDVFDGSENVTVIAATGSPAYQYCAKHGLRWSTSRFLEATVPVDPDSVSEEASTDESAVSAEG